MKPSDAAMQAAREIIPTARFMRDDYCETAGCRCGGKKALEDIAVCIDAAAEAVLRDRLAGLHKLDGDFRASAQEREYQREHDSSVPSIVARHREASLIYGRCAYALRAALDKLEEK